MTNWEAVRKEWETSKITLIDLAEKYGVKEGTLKSRKSREGWKKVATKKDATANKKMQPSKKDATSNQPKKRSGNPNPTSKFSERNNNPAFKHGFYSKFIPAEAKAIFDAIDSMSTSDMLWDQIKIMYTNIMRAQEIMFVESKDEMIKELKREKLQGGKNPSQETEYEFQFAWERQAQALSSQARAMSELRTLINQFIKTADEADERRLKLEHMQISIEKVKAEIDKLGSDEQTGPIEIKIVGKKRD